MQHGKEVSSPLKDKAAKQRLREEILRACADIRNFFDKRRGKILALTDDATFGNLLRSSLKSIGARSSNVVFASSDRQAFLKNVIESGKEGYALFTIVEQGMRDGTSNTDILRKLVAKKPAPVVFVATTSREPYMHALFMEMGLSGVIVKPIDANALLLVLVTGMRELTPEEALIGKAIDLAKEGNGDEALRIASVLVRARPENAGGYLAMGDACDARGDANKAKLAWKMACSKDEKYLAPMGRLSEMARRENDPESELLWLRRMDKVSPLNGERKARLADVCIRTGKFSEAGDYLNQAWRRLDETLREDLRTLSGKLAYALRKNDPAEAERQLRKNLEGKKAKLGPEDIQTFNMLGLALQRQGKNAEAIREYRRALRIVPDSPEILYNLGLAMARNYDRAGAAKVLARAIASSRDILRSGKEVARNMASIFLHQQDYENACVCLSAVLLDNPDDQGVAEMLARIRRKLGVEMPKREDA